MAIRPDQAFVAKVNGVTAAYTALDNGKRLFANAAKQDCPLPLAVYLVGETEHLAHLGGQLGWCKAQIILDIVGKETYASAKEIAEALRIGLHAFKGTVTVGIETAKIGYMGLEKQEDMPEWIDGSGRPQYTVRQTWNLMMVEATS